MTLHSLVWIVGELAICMTRIRFADALLLFYTIFSYLLSICLLTGGTALPVYHALGLAPWDWHLACLLRVLFRQQNPTKG